MRVLSLVLAAAAALCATHAHAIHINEQAFVANGGDLDNIDGTAPNVFDALRTVSLATQFNAVGRVGECSAVRLSEDGNYVWVLTSANCAPNTTSLVAAADALYFTNYLGHTVAGGPRSTSFIHPSRLNRPNGVRDAGTDVALLRLPNLSVFRPAPPMIDDGNGEVGTRVSFIGHGPVGVNGTPVETVWPLTGERRAWGESVIDRTLEDGHVLAAGYALGSTSHWARAGKTDAGTSWWQHRDGYWRIVGLSSTGGAMESQGVRLSKYGPWIKGLMRHASMTSDIPLDQSGAQVLYGGQYVSSDMGPNVRFEIAAGQDVPTTHNGTDYARTYLRVPVTDVRTGRKTVAVVRAWRGNGCIEVPIHNGDACWPGSGSTLFVEHWVAAHELPDGQWRGRLTFDAWEGFTKRGQVVVNLDIVPPPDRVRVQVERYYAYIMGLPSFITAQDVYYTVPAQAGASGPTSGYVNTLEGYSTITVHTRDAVTLTNVPVKLRAIRRTDCGNLPVNNGLECTTSRFEVWFDRSDNPTLGPGRYRGAVDFLLRKWDRFAPVLQMPLRVDVDIDLLVPSMFDLPDFRAATRGAHATLTTP